MTHREGALFQTSSQHHHFSKTPLANETFVDVFSLLTRWQLDPVDISCRQFRHIVSTKLDTVCLRELDTMQFTTNDHGQSTFIVNWWFTADGEEQDLSRSFSEMEEAMEDMTKRITSSAVERMEICPAVLTDEMLVVSSLFNFYFI